MDNPTQEQARKRFNTLPEVLQDAIFSIETANAVGEIGKEHKLLINQTGDLADEIGLLMLGFTTQKDFVPHLERRLNISNEEAIAIAKDAEEKILNSLRETLKKSDRAFKQTPAKTPLAKKDDEKTTETKTKKYESVIKAPPTNLPTQETKEQTSTSTTPIPTPPSNPFEAKFKQNVQSEKSETQFKETETKKIETIEKKKPYSVDPYKEPIE